MKIQPALGGDLTIKYQIFMKSVLKKKSTKLNDNNKVKERRGNQFIVYMNANKIINRLIE